MEITPEMVEAPTGRTSTRLGLFTNHWLFVLIPLCLIVAAGAYFRFVGLDWDEDQHLHPDERFLTMVISSLERPSSLAEYFDTANSRWNPHNTGWDFFVYGTLPIFIIRFVGEELGKTDYGHIYLVGRALSGIFDLLSVLLLFLVARRLYDTRVALLASAFSAAAVLQIQQSHFMTVDTFATTFVMLTLLGAVLVAQEGKWWHYLLMGASLGMAVASRINLAVLPVLAMVAAGLQMYHKLNQQPAPNNRGRTIESTLFRLVVAGVVSFLAFRIFHPYAFEGPGFFDLRLNEAWLEDMRSVQGFISGEIDFPPSHQWTNRPAYLFPLQNIVLWGLGLPLGVTAWIGWLVAGWQILRHRRWAHVLPVVWVLIEFGYHGRQFVKTMRYFLPIYPTLALLAAFLLIWLWDSAKSRKVEKRNREIGKTTSKKEKLFSFSTSSLVPSSRLSGGLIVLVLAGTYLWAYAFTRIYTRPVTRVTASRWIYHHVPSAATLHFTAPMDTQVGPTLETQVPVYLDRTIFGNNGFTTSPDSIPYRTSFAPVADGQMGTITFNMVEDLENDPIPETIEIALSTSPTRQNILATRQIQVNLETNPGPLVIDFAGLPLQADQRYYVFVRAVDGGTIKITGRQTGSAMYMTDHGPETEELRLSYIFDTDRTGILYTQLIPQNASGFRLPQPAQVRAVTMNYLIDPMGDPDPEIFEVAIAEDVGGEQILARAQRTAHLEQTSHPRGEAYTFEFPPINLEADRQYFLITRVLAGAPVQAWSTVIANEHWDDSIPLRLDGKDGFGMYLGFQMQHYNNDSPEKLDQLVEWLDQADYIMLTSNRLYGSIPRLPMRYPITTEYYRLLFAGELGFELAETFTSYPNIGPLEIPDQSAEEAFTVYDHPKVMIYQKTDQFSREHVRALLADEAQGPFIPLKPIEVKNQVQAKELTLPKDRWIRQQEAGTWSAIFNPNSIFNRNPIFTILLWGITLELIGLAFFPLAFLLFARLADRGYMVSRTLGLLLMAWLIWLLSSVTPLPYTRWTIAGSLLAWAGLSVIIAYRHRASITHFVAENRRLLLIGETLFLFAFFAFLLVRMGNPDLWHPARGGEKPMDFAYLNAVIKSVSFPPYDPWFAGGYINYYYFGFVIVGTLIKLTGIVPAIAYNLAVPTLFALTFTGAFCIVYNLTNSLQDCGSNKQSAIRNPVLLGILGGLFVAVIGNLEEVQVLLGGLKNVGASNLRSTIPGLATLVGALQGLLKITNGQSLNIPNDWWFWNASRVMPNGEINEFPYFTFVYADLHAHMIALPFTLLALAMAVQVVCSTGRPSSLQALGITLDGPKRWPGRIDWLELAQLAVWGLIIGALRATNTWDYPTYLVVAAGALGIQAWWREGAIRARTIWDALWRFGLVAICSLIAFWPYIQNYATAYTSAQRWQGPRTTLTDYLTIHGFFLFILGTFLAVETLDWWRKHGQALRANRDEVTLLVQYGAILAAWIIVGLLYFDQRVAALGVALGALAILLTLRPDSSPRRRFISFLFLLGLLLTLSVEYIVLKGDIGRMNTVFKFYIQVWVLWGTAAAASLAWLWPQIRRWSPNLRQAWWGAFIVLFVATTLYPLLATPAKIRDRFDTALGPGLNGMQYMDTAVYHDQGQPLDLPYDRMAIEWMQQNIPGTPVILEGQTVEYRWGSRVAIYTGLPTVIGWRWHQVQQRSVQPSTEIERRIEDVRTIYNTPDPQVALQLLEKYEVAYIYVGPLERAYYDPNGLAKFDQMAEMGWLELVYQNPGVKIYRVNQARPTASLSFLAEPVRREVEPDLLLDRPVDELPVIDDRGWNGLANASPLLSVGIWWLVLLLVGLVAWPLVAVALPGLVDCGTGLAHSAGLLLIGYLVWISASLQWLSYTPLTVYSLLTAVGLISFFVFWRHRATILTRVRQRWQLILAQELLFTLAFLVFTGIRILNPDLWQPWFGGEKPMEFAFLNAILKSAHFPPYDPYFAGGTINYYYYGLYLMSVLIKLTGIVPEVAFNLAIPTLFAFTVITAFNIIYHATQIDQPYGRRIQGLARQVALPPFLMGLAGVLFVAVIGNLDGILQILEQLQSTGNIGHFDYWRSSRIIPFTINEFPFFSFLFADLHPHMINISFSLLVLALLFHLIRSGHTPIDPNPASPLVGGTEGGAAGQGLQRAIFAGLLIISLGAVFIINTWELPTYLGLTLAALLLRSRLATGRWQLIRNGLIFLAIAGLSYLAYQPFYAHYKALHVGLDLVRQGSPFKAFFIIWGFFLFILATYLILALRNAEGSRWLAAAWRHRARIHRFWHVSRLLSAGPSASLALALVSLIFSLGLSGWLLWASPPAQIDLPFPTEVSAWVIRLQQIRSPVLALLIPQVVAAGILLLRRKVPASQHFTALLAFTGLSIITGTEIFILKDFLAGSEWYRMNTVFKFTTQAWVLLGLAAAMALPTIWYGLRAVPTLQLSWLSVFGVLLLSTCIYPIYGTAARVNDRFPGERPAIGTLNGMAFMQTGTYRWPDDNVIELKYTYDALQWLLKNVKGTPVIAEANVGYYREGGLRVSSYTGLPTLLGFHQNEQRYASQVGPRAAQVDDLFRTADIGRALHIIEQLRVSYIYVGQIERAWYPAEGLAKFEKMRELGLLEVIYQNPKVTIYRVISTGGPALG